MILFFLPYQFLKERLLYAGSVELICSHLQVEVLRKPVKTDVTTAVHAINVEAVMSPLCLYFEISQVST